MRALLFSWCRSLFPRGILEGKALRMGGRVFLAFVLAVALGLKYKTNGFEALRPYHLSGLIAVIACAAVYGFRSFDWRRHLRPLPLLIYALFAYVFLLSLLAGGRGWKDGLYIMADSLPFFWLAMEAFRCNEEGTVLVAAQKVAILFVPFSFLTAVVAWLGGKLSLGFADIIQSPSFIARAHGFLGEPTAFGMAAAFAFLLLILRPLAPSPNVSRFWRRAGHGAALLAVASILLSGSRVSILVSLLGLGGLGLAGRLQGRRVLFACVVGGLIYMGLLQSMAMKTDIDAQVYIDNSFRVSDGLPDLQQEPRLAGITEMLQFARGRSVADLTLGCGFGCVQKTTGTFFVGYVDLFFDYGAVFCSLIVIGFGMIVREIKREGLRKGALYALLLMYAGISNLFLAWFFNPFFNYPFFAVMVAAGALAGRQERRFLVGETKAGPA